MTSSTKNIITKVIVDFEEYKKLKHHYEMGKHTTKKTNAAPVPTIASTSNGAMVANNTVDGSGSEKGKELLAAQLNKEFNVGDSNKSGSITSTSETNSSDGAAVTAKVVPTVSPDSKQTSSSSSSSSAAAAAAAAASRSIKKSNEDEKDSQDNLPSTSDLAKELLGLITDTKYKSKARIMFETIGLNKHRGGVFNLDNEQYTPEQLHYIINRLYVTKVPKGHVAPAIKSKFTLFTESLKIRRMKKYVKFKTSFSKVGNSWWMLN